MLLAPGENRAPATSTADLPPAIDPIPPAAPANRPMLVIPGVNAPGPIRARSAPLPPLEPAGSARDGDTPALLGPAALGTSAATVLSKPATSPPVPATKPGSAPAPPLAPPRSTSRLGRYLALPYSTGRGEAEPSAITVEPSTDPAAEAALKRRLERQIHDAVGDKVQEAEVRVVGRQVIIRARGVRFWQRRSVRRTLESLPGLAGFRPTIEIVDGKGP
jgi:hypothetical protein